MAMSTKLIFKSWIMNIEKNGADRPTAAFQAS